jgi:hypothetical protein
MAKEIYRNPDALSRAFDDRFPQLTNGARRYASARSPSPRANSPVLFFVKLRRDRRGSLP